MDPFSVRKHAMRSLPRARKITDYLSRFPLEKMPADAQVLYDLMLAFIETAHPIELNWRITNIENPVEATRLKFHGPSAARYTSQPSAASCLT
jgi:hypothetical protein